MGTSTVETFPALESLAATRADELVITGLTMAAGLAAPRGGVIGVITSSGLGRRRTRTTAAGAGFATNSATGQVADASLFKPGDVITNNAGANIGTVAAGGVNLVTNILTLTANAAVAVASGAFVLGSDGSQVAQGIADEGVDGAAEAGIPLIIGGPLKESKLSGLDATAKTELLGRSAPNGIFIF
jgi:hypothetical protein